MTMETYMEHNYNNILRDENELMKAQTEILKETVATQEEDLKRKDAEYAVL